MRDFRARRFVLAEAAAAALLVDGEHVHENVKPYSLPECIHRVVKVGGDGSFGIVVVVLICS
jgi:hypothetical protein